MLPTLIDIDSQSAVWQVNLKCFRKLNPTYCITFPSLSRIYIKKHYHNHSRAHKLWNCPQNHEAGYKTCFIQNGCTYLLNICCPMSYIYGMMLQLWSLYTICLHSDEVVQNKKLFHDISSGHDTLLWFLRWYVFLLQIALYFQWLYTYSHGCRWAAHKTEINNTKSGPSDFPLSSRKPGKRLWASLQENVNGTELWVMSNSIFENINRQYTL